VDFDGDTAYLVIGVAGRGEEHMDILGKIANTLMDEDNVRRLRKAKDQAGSHGSFGFLTFKESEIK